MRTAQLMLLALVVLLVVWCHDGALQVAAAPAAPSRPGPRGASSTRGDAPPAPSARGTGASSSNRGTSRGKAGGRQQPDARTPEGRASLNVWQRVTHEVCLHLAAGEECSTFISDHDAEFIERQKGFSKRLSKAPLFETPTELCDTIVERFHLTEKNGLDGKDFCDSHFSDLVRHVSALAAARTRVPVNLRLQSLLWCCPDPTFLRSPVRVL